MKSRRSQRVHQFFPCAFFAKQKTGLSASIFWLCQKDFGPSTFVYGKGFIGPLALLLHSPQHALACVCMGMLQSLARPKGFQ
jgi:hypothetical protein